MTIHTTRSTTQTRTTDTWTTDTETTTETTTTTTTTTRTRKALAAAPAPEPEPEPEPKPKPEPKHPAAPAQEVDPPPQVAPDQPEPVKPAAPLAPKSPWTDQDHDRGHDQDHDDAATYEDFEGVRIRVGAAKPRAGYVHWRNRRHVLGAALDVGVPAEVVHHAELMTQNQKPTTLGWKRAEKLIVQVKEAQDAGRDPAPLWKQWMPARPAPELMPAHKPKEKSPATPVSPKALTRR